MKYYRRRSTIALSVVLIFASSIAWAVSPEDKCEADKNKIAGKYAFCRQNEEAKAIKRGTIPDYAKCNSKLLGKWAKAEQKALNKGSACIDSVTGSSIQSFVTTHSDAVAAALDGNPLSGGCPATGQTTCWDSAGAIVACAGTAHDGEVQAGAALAYVDNGDGTITDLNTGLVWEKKSDDGSIHDKDTFYTWDDSFAVHVAGLNSAVFAGYSDWHIPNAKELISIVNYEVTSPAVDSSFDTGCTGGCTVATCSCTLATYFWAATSVSNDPISAWLVDFADAGLLSDPKTNAHAVRAVRGGL